MMAATYPDARPRFGSVTIPLLLIGLGVAFLLRNYGLLPANFWGTLARFWPLLLVALGTELLISGRVGRLAQAAVVGLVLVLGLGATLAFSLFGQVMAGTPTVRTLEQPLEGASRGVVHLEFGAGKLDVGALPTGAGQLASSRLDGPPGLFAEPRYRVRDGVGDLSLGLRGERFRWTPFGNNQPLAMNVQLSPDVPLTLEAELGAAETRLDLSQLKVSQIDLETGASSTWLRLPEAAGLTRARIESGAAAVTIEVPPGVAAQLRYEGGLSSLHVDESRFPLVGVPARESRRGPPRAAAPPTPNGSAAGFPPVPPAPPPPPPPPAGPHGFFGGSRVYRSPDYDTAANKVDLTVESGASTITIR